MRLANLHWIANRTLLGSRRIWSRILVEDAANQWYQLRYHDHGITASLAIFTSDAGRSYLLRGAGGSGRTLAHSASLGAVVPAPSIAAGDLRLATDFIRLQQDFSSQPIRARFQTCVRQRADASH
jgi:hypothetical protein